MNVASFSSRRAAPEATVDKDAQSAPTPSLVPVAAKTRALMLAGTPGIAEMVARGLARDADMHVEHRALSLSDFVQQPHADVSGLDLLIFEIRPGKDLDIAIIRELKSHYGETLQILGVTGETLTHATARTLMEAGVAEVIPLTNTQPQRSHVADLGQLTTQANVTGGDTHDGMIVAVCGAAGGIGTTSFALNLATLLARPSKDGQAAKVAVLDLDFQNGVLGASIDMEDGGGYLDLLRGQSQVTRDLLSKTLQNYGPGGFEVLAAPMVLAPLDAMTPALVASLLDELRLTHDYIVLDLPRALVDWIDAVLARADRYFVLGDTSVHTVRQMRRLVDLYTDDHASLPLELIASREKKPSKAHVKEAEHFLDRRISAWLPPDDKSALKSRDRGQPMAIVRSRAPVIKAMVPIVEAIRRDFVNINRRRA